MSKEDTTNVPTTNLPTPRGPAAGAIQPDPVLSDTQLTVVQALVSGKNVGESAALAGVNRATVFRWLKHDAVFQAAYNAWRRETIDAAQAQLLGMVADAISALRSAARAGNLRAALAILKSTGALTPPPIGSEDPAEVRQQIAAQQRARHAAGLPGLDPDLRKLMFG